MPTYPVIVRNRVPDVQRGLVLAWVAILVLITTSAWRAGPPDGTKWWPLILLLFWATGLFAVRWAFTVEAGQLTVQGAGHARVRRGRPFARSEEALGRLALSIVDAKDYEGEPYFHLVVATPGGPLVIAESHRRQPLEARKALLEAAW